MERRLRAEGPREVSLKDFCDNIAEEASALNDDEVFDLIIHQLVQFYREQYQLEIKSCVDPKSCR